MSLNTYGTRPLSWYAEQAEDDEEEADRDRDADRADEVLHERYER